MDASIALRGLPPSKTILRKCDIRSVGIRVDQRSGTGNVRVSTDHVNIRRNPSIGKLLDRGVCCSKRSLDVGNADSKMLVGGSQKRMKAPIPGTDALASARGKDSNHSARTGSKKLSPTMGILPPA